MTPSISESLQQIVSRVADEVEGQDPLLARRLLFLAVSCAVGWGISGPGFKTALGMSDAEQDEFPAWVGQQLPRLMQAN